MLNTIEHGPIRRDEPEAEPPLLIAHGLFGSGRNWGVIAKRLSDARPVRAVDMRNHGRSPWYDRHGYDDMAADLAEVAEAAIAEGGAAGPAPDVMGHSMGGKAAMMLALTRPELVNRLIVADIAPVAYDHDQRQHIAAMRQVDPTQVSTRAEAAARLAPLVGDPALVAFFLQSLDLPGHRWRLNLDTLDREMDKILGFPETDARFDGPVLFLTGGDSNYVRPEHRARIAELFPQARFMKIPRAGHWLHADRPRAFEAAVRGWLDHSSGG